MDTRRRCRRCLQHQRLLYGTLLLVLLGLPSSTSAQQPSGLPTGPSRSVSTASMPTASASSSPANGDSTNFALSPASSSPSAASPLSTFVPTGTDHVPTVTPNPSSTSTSTSGSAPTSTNGSGSDSDSDSRSDAHDGLLNFYFIFLALFVLLLLLAIWLVHRRRKAQKARWRESGANALARDVERAGATRRWMQGVAPWRIGADGQMACSREDGLNELGEAPPPYKGDEAPVRRTPSGRETAARPEDAAALRELSVPLRTLQRDHADGGKLPGYEESVRGSFVTSDASMPTSGLPSPALPWQSTDSLARRQDEHLRGR